MDVSDVRKLEALKDENGKLKKLSAKAMLNRCPMPSEMSWPCL